MTAMGNRRGQAAREQPWLGQPRDRVLRDWHRRGAQRGQPTPISSCRTSPGRHQVDPRSDSRRERPSPRRAPASWRGSILCRGRRWRLLKGAVIAAGQSLGTSMPSFRSQGFRLRGVVHHNVVPATAAATSSPFGRKTRSSPRLSSSAPATCRASAARSVAPVACVPGIRTAPRRCAAAHRHLAGSDDHARSPRRGCAGARHPATRPDVTARCASEWYSATAAEGRGERTLRLGHRAFSAGILRTG